MLELRNATVTYGAAPAVSDVSLQVLENDRVVVVGPNGAGKTTLINAMAGLHPLAAGTLSFDGRDISRLARHRFCDEGIALVPEGRRLFAEMTVKENLELGSFRSAAKRHRAESLDRVLTSFPVLRERLETVAGTLSGGQQQMLAIGRALMLGPRLLILDEATEGLAPVVRDEIWSCLRTLRERGQSTLVVDKHLTALATLADRAVVIVKGRTVWEGSPWALATDRALHDRYLSV